MCGIVGITGNKLVSDILVKGLKRLEYRGYDSSGIAVSNSGIHVFKAKGKISELEIELRGKDISGTAGIAHTRWATHGGVTEDNAHPHVSNNQIAVVHNGIIENHEDQCIRLKKLGYKFESETDTEVIAHLIHYYYQNHLKRDYSIPLYCKVEANHLKHFHCYRKYIYHNR